MKSDQLNTVTEAEQLFNQGIKYIQQGLLPEAERALTYSIQLNKENPGTHFNLAICFVRQGMYDRALELFEKTIELAPDFPLAYFNAGKVASLLEQFEDAIIYFDRVLDSDIPETQVRTARGMALHGCGRIDEALEEFNRVLAEQADPVCLQYRASCLMATHDFTSALVDIRLLLESGHGSPDVLATQFLCLKHMDKHKEALEAFEQINSIDPSAYKQLSESLAEDLEEARQKANLIAVS